MPNSFSRRDLLSYSSVSLSGLGLGSLLRHPTFGNDAQGTSSATRIKACIFIFQYGGPSHLDTFDMKPDATRDIRGEFEPISSSVPGLPVCEHLPQLSKRMHQVALIRSMHHTNRLHDSASTEVLTGYSSPTGDRENFSPTSQFYPSFGGAMSHLWNHKKLDIVHAALPWVFHNVVNVPCQGGGFVLGASDPNGAYPIEAPVSPADLSATIYWRFGIDPGSEIYDATGRPHRLSSGSPIRALFM